MPISIEQLFAEDYKPPWLIKQEQNIQESFEYATTAAIDLAWKINAYKKARKIARKHKVLQ